MSERTSGGDRERSDTRSGRDAELASSERREGPDSGGRQQEKEERGEQPGRQQGEQQDDSGPSRSHWAVGIGSMVLVAALVGYLIYQAFSGTSSPPVVELRVERILPVRGGYVVEVGVYNEGGSTARSLSIEGTLMRDTVKVESSTATVAFVPAETEREAGLFFTRDPGQYRLELRPLGYDRP